ncbi:unnamed protein product [Protopolystoma xenopodis]|uniref:Uncharacterized protein n=1 Tax=Protopolystoma xenopodis TaxID=117903 RepID=A0A448WDC6_9PLAT|nr:unnamed protein product [Protopolystoma xenopodis]
MITNTQLQDNFRFKRSLFIFHLVDFQHLPRPGCVSNNTTPIFWNPLLNFDSLASYPRRPLANASSTDIHSTTLQALDFADFNTPLSSNGVHFEEGGQIKTDSTFNSSLLTPASSSLVSSEGFMALEEPNVGRTEWFTPYDIQSR